VGKSTSLLECNRRFTESIRFRIRLRIRVLFGSGLGVVRVGLAQAYFHLALHHPRLTVIEPLPFLTRCHMSVCILIERKERYFGGMCVRRSNYTGSVCLRLRFSIFFFLSSKSSICFGSHLLFSVCRSISKRQKDMKASSFTPLLLWQYSACLLL